uniref:Ovule protein n=1 Tax=Heterorhabditis bacteriophora TaxID=37862 RepID=A0A1I7WIQ4_HETBA
MSENDVNTAVLSVSELNCEDSVLTAFVEEDCRSNISAYSEYSLPASETNVEMEVPFTFSVCGATVVDSVECLQMLNYCSFHPIKCMHQEKDHIGELIVYSKEDITVNEYSSYSSGPSETNVTMTMNDNENCRCQDLALTPSFTLLIIVLNEVCRSDAFASAAVESRYLEE